MKSILTTLLVAMLVAPATAVARGTVLVPPGDSASSQYVETVPTDKGLAVPGSGSQPNALTSRQRHQLAALGPDGQTLAAVVRTTSPAPTGAGSSGQAGGRGASQVGSPATGTDALGTGVGGSAGSGPSGSSVPLSAAGAPSTESLMLTAATGGGSGGLGAFLPLLLLAAALGVILHAVLRWRGRAS